LQSIIINELGNTLYLATAGSNAWRANNNGNVNTNDVTNATNNSARPSIWICYSYTSKVLLVHSDYLFVPRGVYFLGGSFDLPKHGLDLFGRFFFLHIFPNLPNITRMVLISYISTMRDLDIFFWRLK
jgi:hypothetical protein